MNRYLNLIKLNEAHKLVKALRKVVFEILKMAQILGATRRRHAIMSFEIMNVL